MPNYPKLPYTYEEQRQILDYIINHHAYYSVKGILLWKEMERLQICKRSWQSMKQRFRNHILPSLKGYKLSQAEMDRIYDGYHNRKKPKAVLNTGGELPTPSNLNAISIMDDNSSGSDNVGVKRKRLISDGKRTKMSKIDQNTKVGRWIQPNRVTHMDDNETLSHNIDSEAISDVLDSTYLKPFGKEEEIKIIRFFEKNLDRLDEKDLDGPYEDINIEFQFRRPIRFLRDRFLNEILPNLIKYNCMSNSAMVAFYDKSDMDIPDQLCEMIDEEYNQKKEKTQLDTVPVATSSSESLDATPPFIRSKNEMISSQNAASTSQLEISQTESHYYSQNESQSKVATEQTGKRVTTGQTLNGTARPPNCRDSLDASIISLNTQLKSPETSIENILPKRDRLKLLQNEVYQNSPGTNHRDRVRLIDKYKSPLHRHECQNEQQVALTTMNKPEMPNLCKSQQVQTSTIQIDSKATMTNPLTFKDVLLRQYGTYCESNCAMVSSIAGSIGMYINKVLHFFVPNSTTDCPQIVKLIANEHCISCKQVHVLEDETFAHIRHCKLVNDEYECFLQNVALKAITLEDYLLASKITTHQSKNNSNSHINETISSGYVATKSQTNILRCSNIENNVNADSSFVHPLSIPTKLTGTDMEIVATATNTLNYNKMSDNLVLRNPLIPNKNMISTKLSDEQTITMNTSEMSGNLNNNSMETNDEMCESSPLVSVDGKCEKNLNKTMRKKSPFKKLSNYFRNKKRDGINKFKCPIANHTQTNNDQNLRTKTGKNDSNCSLSTSTSGNIVQFPTIVDNNVSEIVSNQVNVPQKSSELKEDFFSRSVDDVMNFISNPCQKLITSSQIKNSYCIKNTEQGKNVTYSESTHNIINDSIEEVMNFITSPSSNISFQMISKNCPAAINSKHDRKLVVNMDEMMDFILNSSQNNVTNTQVELPSNISTNSVEQSLIRDQNLNIESPDKIVNSLHCKVSENIISQTNTEVQQSPVIQQNSNDHFDLPLNNIKVTKYNNIDFNPRNSFTNPQIQLSHDFIDINNISGEKIKNNQTDLLPKIASNPTENSPVISVTIHETITNNTPTKENLFSIKEPDDSSELSQIKMQQILEAITIAANNNAQHFCLPEEYFLETPTFSDGTLSDSNYKKAEVSIELQDNSPNKIIEETGISRSSPILKSTNRKLKSHDTEREPRKQNINIDSSKNISITERNSTNPINKENTFENIAKADNSYAFNLSEKVTSKGRRVKNSPKHKRELLKKKVYKQILPISEHAHASISKDVNVNDNTQKITELVPIIDYDKCSTNSGISITSIETPKLNTTNVTKQSESVPINIGDIKLLQPKQPALIKLSPAIINKIKYLHNVDIFPVNEPENSSNNTKINSTIDVTKSEINTKFQNLTEPLLNSNLTILNDMPSPVPKITHTLRNKGLAKPRSKLRQDKNTDNSQQSNIECVLIDSKPNAIKNMSSSLTNKANINYSDKSTICSPSSSIWTDTIVSDSQMSSIQDPLAINQDLIVELAQTNPNHRTPSFKSITSLNCTDSIALKKPTIKLISPMLFRPRRNVLSKRSQMAVKKLGIDTTHLDVKKIALNIANDFVKFEKDEIDAPVFELLETKLEWNSENGEEQLFGELRNPIE